MSALLKDNESKKRYKCASLLCGLNENTAPSTIENTLKTLKGFYVTQMGDIYEVCHDLLMEITSYVFGRYYPRDIIKYADVVFF